MYILEGKTLRYAVNERGQCCSVYNKLSCHEYVHLPDCLWKLLYAEGERTEIPVYATAQRCVARQEGSRLTLSYDGLEGDGRKLAMAVELVLEVDDHGLRACVSLRNDDPAQLMEFQLTAVSGVRSLSGSPEKDAVAWPARMGKRIPNPAFSDLSVYAGFRKYERHDQFHTDLDAIYPARASMQWYDWYNAAEGLYVGSHDTSHHTLCLHVERDVKTNVLRMGVCRYPMLETGESCACAPVVYAPHLGDWHAGSRIYRAFMEGSGNWAAPCPPDWAREFKGWLRVILKQHHCELNWSYADIPRLFDEAQAAGFRTLYLLGWERGGFARLWPDYVVDERMGGDALLRQGIDYVHQKGGKVLMFLSYALIDHQSEYYRNGPGEEVTVKSMWGEEIPFSETYCGEATYRKLPNPPMPMFLSCSGAPKWQEKMLQSADVCLDLGADGVLYDIGAITPFFCYDKRHDHEKPSHANATKAGRYEELNAHIHGRDRENIILMEHVTDIFNQHMDIVHGGETFFRPTNLLEMYAYTFPELVITNRSAGMDEENHRAMVNASIVLGLRFDMSIFRCCGTLSDIPNYFEYLKEVNALLEANKDVYYHGLFRDTDGFEIDDEQVVAKAFEGADGTWACVVWNPTGAERTAAVTFDNGARREVAVPAESVRIVRDR